jgi:carboxyl-terminal processing protease
VDGKHVLTAADPFVAVARVLERIKNGDATEEEVEKAAEAQEALLKKVQAGIPIGQAVRRLTQGTGETRKVVVRRAGVKEPLTLEMTTATTRAGAPETKSLAGGATYLRVSAFTPGTAKEVASLLDGATTASNGGGGLVLDLRGNPGGPLNAIKETAGVLLGRYAGASNAAAAQQRPHADGLLVQVGPGSRRTVIAAPGDKTARRAAAGTGQRRRPMVVLVDEGTTGEAEALAAALRDRGVATLVGRPTFGDALVLTLFPLADGSGYLLPTGKLTGPTGASWQSAGLKPAVALTSGATEEQTLARATAVLHGSRPAVAATRPGSRNDGGGDQQ